MKTVFLLTLTTVLTLQGFAQDRWTVALNSQVLLSAKAEDEAANTVRLKDLKKGSLFVTYVPAKAEGERKRRIMVFDSADRELYARETHNLVVPVASLKKWKRAASLLRIYTIPVLGEEGAAVRLRRVHLCTVRFD